MLASISSLREIIENPDDYLDQTIEIYGWVELIRDQKKIKFINLRNDYNTIQLFLFDISIDLKREDYIHVHGKLIKRSADKINPRTVLGSYEIRVSSIELIGKCTASLPFEIGERINENLKQEFRYLDLRSAKSIAGLKERAELKHIIHTWFRKHNFLEIDTPLFTNTSPEGARDYIVLSIKHPASGYALPQSPQLYKQLLMLAGVRKYYQIAPVFRDEDTRANRLVGEFYQIDTEIADLKHRADLIKIADSLVNATIRKVSPDRSVISETIKYEDAMRIYGSDKPDLRLKRYNMQRIGGEIILNNLESSEVDIICRYADSANIRYKHSTREGKQILSILDDDSTKYMLSEAMNEIHPNIISICYVVDYPLIINKADGRQELSHNPFSKSDIESNTTEQFDIVMNGQEICSGSLRNTDPDSLYRTFRYAGYTESEIELYFGKFIRAYRYGAPRHGGFAIGFERLASILFRRELKEHVAFSLSQSGKDSMLGHPFALTNRILSDYNLQIKRV